MDLSERTFAYITRMDLVGMANAIALQRGALVSEHNAHLPRAYLFTRRTPNTVGPLANDPLGRERGPTVFQIKRCDWNDKSLIEIKEDGILRFLAVSIPYEKDADGPTVRSGGRRYRVEHYVGGCWHGSLQLEYASLKYTARI